MGNRVQVLIGLHRAQLLASSGKRAEALQLLDGCAGQLAGNQEATPRAGHLRLHYVLLRTLCQLAAGETGLLQQADGELAPHHLIIADHMYYERTIFWVSLA